MESEMVNVQVPADHRILARLEALALLQADALPGLPYDTEDAMKQALERGLEQMIRELLVRTTREN